jgi:hypothetical protein
MALIRSDDELHSIFRKAITKGWYKSDTGLARFQAAIKNTQWWQSRTASQRAFDEQELNPAERKDLMVTVRRQRMALRNLAGKLGVELDPDTLDKLARVSVRNGMSQDQVNRLISKHFEYHANEGYTGAAGMTIDQIRQMAAAYYVPVGHRQMQEWTQQAIAGALDPQSLQDYFQQQAASMFPYLEKQLKAGQTVASIADPYRQLMAQTLELDPEGIKNTDRLVMQGLQAQQKDGQLGLMPLWQYQKMLRQDSRWLKTDNAKQSMRDVGVSILRDFGLTA